MKNTFNIYTYLKRYHHLVMNLLWMTWIFREVLESHCKIKIVKSFLLLIVSFHFITYIVVFWSDENTNERMEWIKLFTTNCAESEKYVRFNKLYTINVLMIGMREMSCTSTSPQWCPCHIVQLYCIASFTCNLAASSLWRSLSPRSEVAYNSIASFRIWRQ